MTHTTFCHPELVSGSHQPEMLKIVDFIKSLFVKCFSMTYLKKAVAFTLAETLVVMGIIGVVAALTIPNLNQSTGDREKVAKVKKIYANLEDAFGRATAVYGPYEEWFNGISGSDAEKRIPERILEFMKVSKNCGLDEKGCFSSSVPTDLNGEELDDSYDNWGYRVILADGASLQLLGAWDKELRIRVDIDGPNKGKNQYGIDIFDFTATSMELSDSYCEIPGDFQLSPSSCPNRWTGNYNSMDGWGSYATAWIIQNGNLDYLKCAKELDWDTKTSCK